MLFLITQKHLGVGLGETIEGILDDMKAAADESWDIVFGDSNYIAYQAG